MHRGDIEYDVQFVTNESNMFINLTSSQIGSRFTFPSFDSTQILLHKIDVHLSLHKYHSTHSFFSETGRRVSLNLKLFLHARELQLQVS